VIASLALLLIQGGALAQDAPADLEQRLAEQEELIRKLAEEVDTLKHEHQSYAEEPLAVDAAEDTPPPITSGHDQGVELGLFYVRSADHAHEINLHARIMLDARFDVAKDYFDHTFQTRRARFTLEGHVFEHVGYKLGLEFGRSAAGNLRDAYIKFALSEEIQLWGGQMIVPFSTSRLISSNYMKHPERPIIVALLGGRRDVGAQFYGKLLEKRITYWLGIYNGTTQNIRQDNDDDFDLATRVEVRPVDGLQLSANYLFTPTNRSSFGPLDVRTVGNQASKFLDYDTLNTRRLGKRHRVGGGARFNWGPVEIKGEVNADYVRKVTSTTPGGVEKNLLTWSYFVDASVVLTGEENKDIVIPDSPFFGEDGFGTGAFELAARFEDFRADPDAIRQGFAAGTDKVKSGSVTFTWIPVERMRWMVSYTGSAFSDRVADPHGSFHRSDHVVTLRMHLFF
jgi:phosphate-selective porin